MSDYSDDYLRGYNDGLEHGKNSRIMLCAKNEKLRAALIGVTRELGTFVGIFKGYQGMTMNNAQAALNAAAAALKETGDE